MNCNWVSILLPFLACLDLLTQLDKVANDTHDDESNAHSLRDLDEFTLVRYSIVLVLRSTALSLNVKKTHAWCTFGGTGSRP